VIVGFVIGEEFGAVCLAEEDGAGGYESVSGGGIVGGGVAEAVEAAGEGGVAGEVEAVFDGEGDAGEGAIGVGLGREEADEGAEVGVGLGDAILVGAEEFGRRDIAAAERIALLEQGPVDHNFILVNLDRWYSGGCGRLKF
jgi:hypothetical protein